MEGKYVENERSRGREKYNHYIMYEKIFIFNFKKWGNDTIILIYLKIQK